jgi:hypothetical protein
VNSKYKPILWGIILAGSMGLIGWVAIAGAFEVRIKRNLNGSITMDWDSQPGFRYEVYWRTNLLESIAGWQMMSDITASNTSMTITDDGGPNRPPPSNDSSRFYLLREIGSFTPNPTFISNSIARATTWTISHRDRKSVV